MAMDPFMGSSHEVFPVARGQPSCWSPEAHLFMTSNIAICLFLNLSTPPGMEVLPQYSGCCGREKNFSICIPHSWESQVFIQCFSFAHGREHHFSPTLCYLSGGAMLAKFLLPSPVQLNSYCCCSSECWNLSSGNLDFYKCSFTCGHLSKSEPSR